jgi:tRNA nucleotidyltransferase/poly(A) polymerase
MPDYIYLLESRLGAEQRAALARVREAAQALGINIYLAGGAVRDLITGMPIRDLDFIVEGNPFRLARDLEKAGAVVTLEDEKLRHVEMLLPGEVDGSIAAARHEVYAHPGAKPETHWGGAMDDLRRRDFSLNAIALSLNPASLGLLLDPTNGLADLEARLVRALSIHSFTNQPVRLLRVLRYAVRMDFKIEPRTLEWFNLAIERRLHESIDPEAVGQEVRQLAREDRAAVILKEWEKHKLIFAIHPQLARRHPDYDNLAKLARVREAMLASGHRIPSAGLFAPTVHYVLRRLKSREQSSAIHRMEFRRAETEALANLHAEAEKTVKLLKGPLKNLVPKGALKPKGKAAEARLIYNFLEKVPLGQLAFIQADYSQLKALSLIRTFLHKWKPLRNQLPAAELEALGMPRGPAFDKVLESFFDLQLVGKGRNPQDRIKLLRKLAGIKPEAKKKEKPEKKKEEKKARLAKGKKGAEPAAAQPSAPSAPPGTPAVGAAVAKPAKGKTPEKPAPPEKGKKGVPQPAPKVKAPYRATEPKAARKPKPAKARKTKSKPKPKARSRTKGARKASRRKRR